MGLLNRMFLLPVLGAATATPSAIDVQNVLSSNATTEQKTSFLINWLLDQRAPLMDLGKNIIIAILFWVIGRKIIRLILKLINRWMTKADVETSVLKFTISLSKAVLTLLLLFMIAGVLGVGTSSIVALVGSAGLTVGLALQGSLSNFAGGVLILLLHPFRVGDYIITSNAEGTVKGIDIFYTHLVTTDNKKVVVPNGSISNSNVINTTEEESRMLIIDFMVGYDSDIDDVKRILLSMMKKEETILKDKPMNVVIDKLNPGRVKMQAKAWVLNEKYWDERYRLMEMIKKELEKNGISIM